MVKTIGKSSGKFALTVPGQLFSYLLLILFLFSPVNVFAVDFPGPDSFGYTGTSIPLNLRDISSTGTNVGLDSVDDSTTIVPIGFSFEFYGVSYTQIQISSNGFITFSPGGSECCNGESIPNSNTPNNYIAGWWTDLHPGSGGIIRTQLIGTPGDREFVIGFYDVSFCCDDDINTFEIILYEGSNNIEIAMSDVKYDGSHDMVAGIENADGTDGVEIVFLDSATTGFNDGDSVISNQGYLFSPEEAIPTLNEWGMIIFSLLMAGSAFWFIRKERHEIC